MLSVICGYLFIFFARICDVSMTTMRTLMVVRGQRAYAAIIGFFEAIIYIVVLNKIFTNLDNPFNLLFYAAGFATGNYVGSYIEEKVAVGILTVQVITMKSPLKLTEKLRGEGYGVTVIEGSGREGKRYILQIILKRKRVRILQKEIDEWDDDAFWTIFDARCTKGGVFARKGKCFLTK
ncbi:MAG: DUF2179 domain-containing protein [Clostridia bacterium]|nr:DUF2179 domain-containing protein [Clostridia bacterium]MDD4048714.1 DUF2179 domain-containing protein [Clostridia bacterium]